MTVEIALALTAIWIGIIVLVVSAVARLPMKTHDEENEK